MSQHQVRDVNAPLHPLVVLLVVIVGGQAVALLYFTVLLISEINQGGLPVAAQLFLIFLTLLASLWLILTARGVWVGRSWTRAAVAVVELFAVILSASFFSAGNIIGGFLMLLPAAIGLLLLFTPALSAHIQMRQSSS